MVPFLVFLLSSCNGQEYIPKENYRFSYAVEDNYSGNQFGHTESTDGAGTAGVYHVRLPDGRLQTVQYTVDARGYHATVLYEGGAEILGQAPTGLAKFVHEPVIYLDDRGGGNHLLNGHIPPPVSGAITQPPAPISSAYNPHTNLIPSPYPPPYEASFSILQPQYVPHFSNNDIQLGSFILPQAFDSEPAHVPVSSLPPHPPSAVVHAAHAEAPPPAVQHVTPLPPAAPTHFSHLPFSLPLVQPPEHHKDIAPRDPDPYLASEQELLGRSFDDPFWYPKHRHIIKGYRNKEFGDKVDHRDKVN